MWIQGIFLDPRVQTNYIVVIHGFSLFANFVKQVQTARAAPDKTVLLNLFGIYIAICKRSCTPGFGCIFSFSSSRHTISQPSALFWGSFMYLLLIQYAHARSTRGTRRSFWCWGRTRLVCISTASSRHLCYGRR